MYGVAIIEKKVTDEIEKYIERNFDALVKYANAVLVSRGAGCTPLGGDLVTDVYIRLKDKMEDVEGCAMQSDAEMVVKSYIKKAANSKKYYAGNLSVAGTIAESMYDMDGKCREDIEYIESIQNDVDGVFELDATDVKYAIEYIEDSFEYDIEDVEKKIKAAISLAQHIRELEKTASKESKESVRGIIAAVTANGYKNATDELKEAFRVLMAAKLAEMGLA